MFKSIKPLTNLIKSSIAKRSLHIKNVNQSTFTESMSNKNIIIADFYADWCGPCKQLSPVLDRVIPSTSKTVDLITINTDEQSELATQFSIRSLPTVIAFKEGKVIGKFVGGRNDAGVEAFLEEIGVVV